MRSFVTAIVLSVLTHGVAFAQRTPADVKAETEGRYNFSRSGDDFLRLDRATGQVSRCSQRSAGWACEAVPEERAAFENEIARLQDENAALKKQIADATPAKSAPKKADKGYRVPEPQVRLPTNEDIDRAVAMAGKVWKRLVQMLNDARSDMAEKI